MSSDQKVKVYEETVEFPTWTVGPEDPNPIFLERRVYQGSSGVVYPYGVIDTVTGRREMCKYRAIWLENDFIRVMLLPELGGRIQRAYDKVVKRDFIYFNEVVKPAMVGLLGPWISGGIEFNWPQHHRPTTFMPVDVSFGGAGGDGSATVWLGETEPMHGLQVMTGFKLYPDRALVEITGKVFNGNVTPRHFLWWANPAVKGGDGHQSVFPPDVTAVYDHGRRDVSAFPIARGVYYKVDYSAGVDISRYKNIPVPTSFMAAKSDYDFVGAYDHNERGGLLHVANHHISPGKKQWTWGNCDFGQAWDRNLTERNGPYIELMTGVYTDNQPDFTWIAPYEEKVFVQNFMPYSRLGTVQNANTFAAIKLERSKNGGGELHVGVYAVRPLNNCKLCLRDAANKAETVWEATVSLGTAAAFEKTIKNEWLQRWLVLELVDADGKTVRLSYKEHIPEETPLPSPAEPPLKPKYIMSTDQCYFIGQHLEQYRHARRFPEFYYRRALELDKRDYRCNVALGLLAYNSGDWKSAEHHGSVALERAHWFNKNPRDGQASLLRGCAREKLGNLDGAWGDYFKSTWSGDCRDAGYYNVARMAMGKKDSINALELVNQCLLFNGSNNLAMGIKALAMFETGKKEDALTYITQQLKEWPLSYVLHYARWAITKDKDDEERLRRVTGCRGANVTFLCAWLVAMNMNKEAKALLELIGNVETIPLLWQASLCEENSKREELLAKAQANLGLRVRFPNTVDEVFMLERLKKYPFAQYMLGCFYYSKRRYEEAKICFDIASKGMPNYGPVKRMLGIHAWNRLNNLKLAEPFLKQARELDPGSARYLFEYDCLMKINAQPPIERLALLEKNKDLALSRDDLTAELLNLLNINGKLEEAAKVMHEKVFHPWEGGEGKITSQYLINHMRRAIIHITKAEFAAATGVLKLALKYPENLGEGKLPGQTDNDLWYLLGLCAEGEKKKEDAKQYFHKALSGGSTLEAGQYYNDMPVDYQFWKGMALHRTGEVKESLKHFRKFLEWVEHNRGKKVEPDFFAVSLPDLITVHQNPTDQHEEHCLFVEALGELGLGHGAGFEYAIRALLARNPAHDKANFFKFAWDNKVINFL